MLGSIFSSWHLFWATFVAAILIAIVLSILGILLVARRQIFLGMAISQTSTLGIAIGLILQSHAHTHFSPMSLALFAMLGALATSVLATTLSKNSLSFESVIAFLFLLTASASVLIVSKNPFGLEEIHRVLASNLFGAQPFDIAVLLGFIAIIAVLWGWKRAEIMFYLSDREGFDAALFVLKKYDLVSSVLVGIVLGYSIRIAGILFCFGCLILPVLCSKKIARSLKKTLLLTPLIAFFLSTLGVIVSDLLDFPTGQFIVVTMCVFYAVVFLLEHLFSSIRKGVYP